MSTSYANPVVWGVILVIGVVTYAIRLSFIALFSYVEEIPTDVKRGLRFVPAAVLAALVLPALVTTQPETGDLATDRLIAGCLAGGVAWRTENVFATIGVGMAAFWTIRFVV
jgi:branched-subunit amino acid transport protein